MDAALQDLLTGLKLEAYINPLEEHGVIDIDSLKLDVLPDDQFVKLIGFRSFVIISSARSAFFPPDDLKELLVLMREEQAANLSPKPRGKEDQGPIN